MRRIGFFAVVSVVFLAFAMIFASCGAPIEERPPVSAEVSSLNIISMHPTSTDYLLGDTDVAELKVKIRRDVPGTFSYQWYSVDSFTNSGGTPISGETEDTFRVPAGTGTVYYYVGVTNTIGGSERFQAGNPARIRFLDTLEDAPTVNLNVSNGKAQYVRGYGGMSNAFGLSGQNVRYMQMRDIDTMFNPDTGLGYNILRIMIFHDPLEDVIAGRVHPQMGNGIYYDIVKRVNEYGGYVLASPWTPPPYMKLNGSIEGDGRSNLDPKNYNNYGVYLKNWAKQLSDNGAPIYTLSIQNEYTYPASYEGCLWTDAEVIAFYKVARRFLTGVPGFGGGVAIPNVLSMSAEPHSTVARIANVAADAEANAQIDIYSHHTYGNMSNKWTAIQNPPLGPKELWMTEKNINSGSGMEARDYSWNYAWTFAKDLDHTIRCIDANAYVWWYLKRYYSMVSDNTYGSVHGAVLPRGWVMSHYAKYSSDTVRVPATIVGHPNGGNASDDELTGASSTTTFVKASAFRRIASSDDYWYKKVQENVPAAERETSLSLVVYDSNGASFAVTNGNDSAVIDRTHLSGTSYEIRVNLPSDFTASSAHGIISDSTGKRQAPLLVTLAKDGKTAQFNLPANSIVSIKFFSEPKEEEEE